MYTVLIEFVPIIGFFVAYKLYDIYIATIVCMICILGQMIYSFFAKGKIENSQIITLIAIAVLGGATIWLHNEMFIKWKPTVVYWVFSLLFIFSKLIFKQTLSEKIMKKSVNLSQKSCRQLNNICAVFFMIMGFINIWVVYHYSTDVWVNFKLFGSLGLTVLFAIIVAMFIKKNIIAQS